MKNRIKVVVILGTRPEAVKLAPVILELKKYPEKFETIVLLTAQHREMLDQTLSYFNIKSDIDLDIMTFNQSLDQILTKAHLGIGGVLGELNPDVVLVQGDTTTTMAGAVAAYHHQIKVGHVEAGLRSFDKYNPFPEEINRTITDSIADFCFAPTGVSRNNLIKAGIDKSKIFVTGNTVVDALMTVTSKDYDFEEPRLKEVDFNTKKVLLLTTHRRENYLTGDMSNIFQSLNKLIKKHQSLLIVFPLHLNPNVRKIVEEKLDKSDQVLLTEPLGYKDLVKVMKNCYLVLTDSGGIQEEAPTFGKPVLILRNVTERPEGIQTGVAKLVGTKSDLISSEVDRLLVDATYYKSMSHAVNPYGDGHSAERIVQILKDNFPND